MKALRTIKPDIVLVWLILFAFLVLFWWGVAEAGIRLLHALTGW